MSVVARMRFNRRKRFSRKPGSWVLTVTTSKNSSTGCAEQRHGRHGRLEILVGDRCGGGLLDLIDRLGERLFLDSFEQVGIGRLVVGYVVFLLLDAQDVDGALGAGEQIGAVLGVEEFPERLDPLDDHQEIVAAEREHGIDQIVPRALLPEMHLEPVGEEGEADLLPQLRTSSTSCQSDRALATKDLLQQQRCSRTSFSSTMRMMPSAARRSA